MTFYKLLKSLLYKPIEVRLQDYGQTLAGKLSDVFTDYIKLEDEEVSVFIPIEKISGIAVFKEKK